MNVEKDTIISEQDFISATGTIDYTFLNDYMFRAILQTNQAVLKALICALLHLRPKDVQTIRITNPIKLGETIDNKTFILDIDISLNDNTSIDLELQVNNEYNWTDRSLSYLCRNYDNLFKGNDYSEASHAIHIGLLDFTPFPEMPEFYASYKLMNVKNHHLYSSKFALNVLDLKQIDTATEEDKKYQIDRWARLFKATTWDELKRIVGDDEYMYEASKTLYEMNGDETVRAQCRAREDYEYRQKMFQRKMAELTSDNRALQSENDTLHSENDTLHSENDTLHFENNTLHSEIEKLRLLQAEHGIKGPQ
jgi:predicted transposase/invertase (TIGR01784 family)